MKKTFFYHKKIIILLFISGVFLIGGNFSHVLNIGHINLKIKKFLLTEAIN